MTGTRNIGRLAPTMLILLSLWMLPATAGDSPAVWELRGRPATVRLLGSIHFLRRSDYPLPAVVDRILEEADTVVFELDIDDLDPMVSQMLIVRLGMLDDGRQLRDVMGNSDYRKAERLAADIGLDLGMLAGVEPWYAALNVMTLQMLKLGFEPELGLDEHLAARASAGGKEVLGLETIEFQLGLFDELPESTQSELLLQTLAEATRVEQQMDRLVSAWRHGRSEALSGELSESFREYPGVYRRLVVDRNRDWIDKILDLSDRGGNVLVVVGALHLVGKDSVVDMLRARGVQVVPLGESASSVVSIPDQST
jgi:uncharacterized protein YbaP (TraB family)